MTVVPTCRHTRDKLAAQYNVCTNHAKKKKKKKKKTCLGPPLVTAGNTRGLGYLQWTNIARDWQNPSVRHRHNARQTGNEKGKKKKKVYRSEDIRTSRAGFARGPRWWRRPEGRSWRLRPCPRSAPCTARWPPFSREAARPCLILFL